MDKVENLFSIVKIIKEKHDLSDKFYPKFNIFSILRKESDEVNLHSKFIYELLWNIPYYSNKFIDDFLKIIECTNFRVQDELIKVRREYQNIDILITNEKQAIIIENKIWAEDGEKQLETYYRKMKDKYEDVFVCYLTLNGKSPSQQSKGNIEEITLLSYKKHIINWINKCMKESTTIPSLRETLIQYLEVVNKLIGKSKNKSYHEEIAQHICQDPKNLEIAMAISRGVIEAQKNIQLSFWNKLEEKLSENEFKSLVKWKYNKTKVSNYYDKKQNNRYYGLLYNLCKIDEDYSLSLYIEIDHQIYWGFGIIKDEDRTTACNNQEFENLRKETINIFKNKMNKKVTNIESKWWLAITYPISKIDFRNVNDNIPKLCDEEYFNDTVEKIVKDIEYARTSIVKKLGIQNNNI